MSVVYILAWLAAAVGVAALLDSWREHGRQIDAVIEDVMGVPPRGARFAYQCTLCRRDAIETVHDADEFIAMVHNPRPVCDECTDTLARLETDA